MIAVTLRVTDEVMISDLTAHAAALLPGVGWIVSWMPGDRPLERKQAVTAMRLAEAVAEMQTEGRTRVIDHTHPMWPHIDAWAAELGLTGPDAVVRVSEVSAIEAVARDLINTAPRAQEDGAPPCVAGSATAYPLPRPPGSDSRFTLGLVFDVARVLAEHGYPPVATGRDLARMKSALFDLIYQPTETVGGEQR